MYVSTVESSGSFRGDTDQPLETLIDEKRFRQDLYFRFNVASIDEGVNYRVKLTIRTAYGFSNLDYGETTLYHTLGKPPEPKLAHEFC